MAKKAKKKVAKKKINKKKVAKNSEFITDQSVHEANKREAFDARRAYHNSEIAHKKDAVEILKTVLTIIILVYGGLIGLVFSDKIDVCLARHISLALLIFISLSVYIIVMITNKKIDKDHQRYKDYTEEHFFERKFLKIDDDLEKVGYKPVNISQLINPDKSGYEYTKDILIAFGFIIVFVAIIGSVFIFCINGTGKNDGKKKIPVFHHRQTRHKLIR